MALALLALVGAASWGAGDVLAGLASRRAHELTVLVLSQLEGLVGTTAWVVVSSDAWPGLDDALPAAGAGLAGAIGLGALYRITGMAKTYRPKNGPRSTSAASERVG